MSLKASKFIKNRKSIITITNDRLNHIMWYAIECYQLFIDDCKQYSKSWVSTNTTMHFEDYLKMELVDNYLIPNKGLLTKRISSLEEINFSYENQKRYSDILDGIEKPDKIDVHINKLGLKNAWNSEDENIYFAIECKRIKRLSDTENYLQDIQNFCNRNYKQLRLPFEGQIAFIENSGLNHLSVSSEINRRLKLATTIITKQFLTHQQFHPKFQGSYSSMHQKNFGRNQTFLTFSLLLDYSNIVID